MNSLGERLRVLREKNNFTLDYVAKKLNTTGISIGRYEKNQREPRSEMLNLLADFYNVSVEYLMGRTNIPRMDIKYDESDIILLESIKELNEDEKKKVDDFIKFLKFNREK